MADEKEEPLVLALVDDDPTVRKQILENITHKPLTAIGKARAIARIILEEEKVFPNRWSEDIYFQKMFTVKTTAETAQLIEETLGISQYQYYRFRKLLELPLSLQYMADQADIPKASCDKSWRCHPKSRKGRRLFSLPGRTTQCTGISTLLEGDGLDETAPKKRKPRAPKSPVVKITTGFQRSLIKIKDELESDPKFLDKAATDLSARSNRMTWMKLWVFWKIFSHGSDSAIRADKQIFATWQKTPRSLPVGVCFFMDW